jgi:hypothetical protein
LAARAVFFEALSALFFAGQALLSAPQAFLAALHSAFAAHLPSLQQGHLQSSPQMQLPSWQQVHPSTQAHWQSSPHLQASPQQQALSADTGTANHAPGTASANATKALNRKFLRVFMVFSPLIDFRLDKIVQGLFPPPYTGTGIKAHKQVFRRCPSAQQRKTQLKRWGEWDGGGGWNASNDGRGWVSGISTENTTVTTVVGFSRLEKDVCDGRAGACSRLRSAQWHDPPSQGQEQLPWVSSAGLFSGRWQTAFGGRGQQQQAGLSGSE